MHQSFGAAWTARTPSDSTKIIAVYTPWNEVSVDCALAADGFIAEFAWGDDQQLYGSQQISPSPPGPVGSLCYGVGINRLIWPSRYVSFGVECYSQPSCPAASNENAILGVHGIDLEVQENSAPAIHPTGYDNLWYKPSAFVRGTWPLSFTTDDPSGVCATGASIDGQRIAGKLDPYPDQSQWQQCPDLGFDHQVDTTQYPDGPMSLQLFASNTPGVLSSPAETVDVDNQAPVVALSGPTDAASTAGIQYIDVSASAGPSGVSSIDCSLDGALAQAFPGGNPVRIPVQGVGAHQLRCTAQNGAIDSSGVYGSSPPASWNLTIRQPAVSTVSFARIADKLRCTKHRERVHIPARWIYERVHGHRVRVHVPAQTRRIKVVRCHRRPGRAVRATKRIHFGSKTSVSGWLGTADGRALGGQLVQVITAPDNGSHRFRTSAIAVTDVDGAWTARLPAGPSRLVRAAYGGSQTVEPAMSSPARVIVPASPSLRIRPHRTHWGGTIAIRGRLRGGHVPRAGELVVLWIGWPGGRAEIGHLYARRSGRFSSPYTFLRGTGTVTYRLWAATARESDYPYSPARSRTIRVTVHP